MESHSPAGGFFPLVLGDLYIVNIENNYIHILKSFKEQFQKILQKSIQPILYAQNNFQKSLNKSSEPILTSQGQLIKEFAMSTKPLIDFQKQLQAIISPVFEQFKKSFSELPPQTQEALLTLGNHGWFLDPEMGVRWLMILKKALSNGDIDDAENALIEFFCNRLDIIESLIVAKFPRREKIIKAAFVAHRREEYELSIPVLLAQTDGICKEVIGQHFFIRGKNKKPQTAIYVEQITNGTMQAILLQPLAQVLPINKSEKERDENFSELNRHMVLHGESLDYGTKVKALKAISLINYVTHMLTNP